VLGVHPNFRGRGVAKALITTIEKTFLQMGFDYSFVGTPEINKNGVALYEHLNYIPFQRLIFL